MTDDELKAIEARMHAASPDLIEASIGTAFDANEFLSASVLYCDDDEDTPVWEFRTHGLPSPTAENDARLFAHAKRDIFHLCAEVRCLKGQVRRLRRERAKVVGVPTPPHFLQPPGHLKQDDSLLSTDVERNK